MVSLPLTVTPTQVGSRAFSSTRWVLAGAGAGAGAMTGAGATGFTTGSAACTFAVESCGATALNRSQAAIAVTARTVAGMRQPKERGAAASSGAGRRSIWRVAL